MRYHSEGKSEKACESAIKTNSYYITDNRKSTIEQLILSLLNELELGITCFDERQSHGPDFANIEPGSETIVVSAVQDFVAHVRQPCRVTDDGNVALGSCH